jgi:glycosyltransferase involved in cell wall biosynthesis
MRECDKTVHRMLWLGSFLDEKTNQVMIAQGYKNAASYVSQKNLLEGIEAESGFVFDSVNAVSMAGYPRQGDLIMKHYRYSHAKGAIDICVGFFNPLYANKFFMKKAMLQGVKAWVEKRYKTGDELEVFIYEMRSACLDAAAYIKKKISKSRIHLIIPDLPCFMDLNMSKVKKTLKDLDWKQMKGDFKYIDNFFPYAETMVDYLGIMDRKWMVMEGSISEEDIQSITSEIREAKRTAGKSEKHIVMYSGAIGYHYGIDELVTAMDYLDNDYELWITGGGACAEDLKEKIKNNSKVKYYGFLPTREELFKLQAQADILMNIRDPAIESTHYCFPSKIFEYMLLGRPVISVKLKGIPDEYFEYMYGLESINPKEIADKINEVMEDPNRTERAHRGRKFIAKEKNNVAQARKIIEFTGLKSTSERSS